jgi:hypothetical protein
MVSFLRSDSSTSDIADSIPQESAVPAWLLAADNHNIGNSRGSWLSPASWAESFGNAGKFVAVSALSGGASFYNSAIALGNWFGAGAEELKTDTWITSIDANLGQYYSQNREAADLVGFIAVGFMPGLAGVKMLNAGQRVAAAAIKSGHIEGNMARATGLLVPRTEQYLKLAKAEVSSNAATFSTLRANSLKAYASGFQQNFLESLAFEGAVFATMHQAPIFEDMDAGDIVKNIAMGAAVGTAIGGTFEGVRTFYKLKQAGKLEDLASKPFTSKVPLAESASPSAKIILSAEARDSLPVPLLRTLDDVGENAAAQAQYKKDVSAFLQTQEKINNDIRQFTHDLTGTDVLAVKAGAKKRDLEIGNLLADTMHVKPEKLLDEGTGGTHVLTLQNLGFAEEIGRVRARLGVEAEIKQAVKDMDPAAAQGLSVKFVKLFGDDAGEISLEEPKVLSLADALIPRAGESSEDVVRAFVKDAGFKSKKLWDAAKLSGVGINREAEARMIWVRDNLSELPENMKVHANDIPVLEHALATNQWDKIQVVGDSGSGAVRISSSQQLYSHLEEVKQSVADALQKAKPDAPVDLIARTVNVSKNWLEGNRNLESPMDDLFWRQGVSKKYTEWKKSQGLVSDDSLTKSGTVEKRTLETEFIPEHVKIAYRVPEDAFKDINGHVIDGMVYFREQEKLAREAGDRVFAAHAKQDDFPDITDSMLEQSNRGGAGPGLFSFAAGAYNSLESTMMQVGARTKQLKDSFKEAAKERLNAPLVALAQKPQAAIEFEALNREMALSAEKYVFIRDGAEYGFNEGPGMIARKILLAVSKQEDGLEELSVPLQKGSKEYIPIRHAETANAVEAHTRTVGNRAIIQKDISAAYGKTNALDENTYYPVRPNPKDYPYIAFVKDDRVTGSHIYDTRQF